MNFYFTKKVKYVAKKLFLFLLFSIFLISCNEKFIASDINQQQANEIIALLNSYGIVADAEKGSGSRAMYSVSVKAGSYHQAVSLLHEKKLPTPNEQTFEDLVSQKGIIPNSREIEYLRLDHAMAREIEEILENHPSVVSAKSIVRLNFLQENSESGVSVVIQTAEKDNVDIAKLSEIISGIAPGVLKDNINIVMAPLKTANPLLEKIGVQNDDGVTLAVPLVPLLVWMVPEGDLEQIVLSLIIAIIATLLVGFSLGYLISYLRRRKNTNVNSANAFLTSGSIETSRKQLPGA